MQINLFDVNKTRGIATVKLNSKPRADQNVNMTLDFYDLDVAGECRVIINGRRVEGVLSKNTPANDKKMVRVKMVTPGTYWKNGDNTVTFVRVKTQGFRVTVANSWLTTSKVTHYAFDDQPGGSTPTPTPDPAPPANNSGRLVITQQMLTDATSKPHEVPLATVPKNFSFHYTPNPYNGDKYYNDKYDFVNSVPRAGRVNYTHINDWNKLQHLGGNVRNAVVRLNPVNVAVLSKSTGKWFVRGAYVQDEGFVSKLNEIDTRKHRNVVKQVGGERDGYSLIGLGSYGWPSSSPKHSVHGWSAARAPFRSFDIDVIVWWMTAQIVSKDGKALGNWADSLYSFAVGGDVFNANDGKFRQGFQGRQHRLGRQPRMIIHTNADGNRWRQLIRNGNVPKEMPLA